VTDPIQPWPVSRKGDQGHPILTLQELLRAHGNAIAVDGVFGPLTEAAVRAVQTAAGVTVDGVVGPQTWPKVVVTVRRGSTGDAVRGVQVEFQFRNLSGDPAQGLQVDGHIRPEDRGRRPRLPGRPRRHRRRHRGPGHLARARERDALVLAPRRSLSTESKGHVHG
jgi:hypothetical protein